MTPHRAGAQTLTRTPSAAPAQEPFLTALGHPDPADGEQGLALRIDPVERHVAPAADTDLPWTDEVSAPQHPAPPPSNDVAPEQSRWRLVFLALAGTTALSYGTYAYLEIAHPGWWRHLPWASVDPVRIAADPVPAASVSNTAQAPVLPPTSAAHAPHTDNGSVEPTKRAVRGPSIDSTASAAKPAAPSTNESGHSRRAADPDPARPGAPGRVSDQPAHDDNPPITIASVRDGLDLQDAWRALDAGRTLAALTLYRQALIQRPDWTDARLGEAAALARLGRLEEARRGYLSVLESDGDNTIARANLLLLEMEPSDERSERAIQELIVQQPSAFLYALLGHVHAGRGRWQSARDAFQTAHHLQPGQPEHAFNLAVSLEHLGDAHQALVHYRQALDNGARHARPSFDLALASRRIAALDDDRVD